MKKLLIKFNVNEILKIIEIGESVDKEQIIYNRIFQAQLKW